MMSKPITEPVKHRLGCIADDLTGACDLALMLSEHGLPTTLTIGVEEPPGINQAMVIALKSRTCSKSTACRDSLAAAEHLLALQARQIYFKYCSTFDSTPAGNIGPVTDCLMAKTGEALAVVCPAFPDAGRTVMDGILYVHGVPLAESPMKDHPLTPMSHSSLVTLMDQQTQDGATALIRLDQVRQGPGCITQLMNQYQRSGRSFVVTDAITNDDLIAIGQACRNRRLVTGGSGLAAGVAPYIKTAANDSNASAPTTNAWPGRRNGPVAIIAGSCSTATLAQVDKALENMSGVRVDPLALAQGAQSVTSLTEQYKSKLSQGAALLYSSASPESVEKAHQSLGVQQTASLLENAMAAIAARVRRDGVGSFIVAGGETSGAVARAMGVRVLHIGPKIAAGVPWMTTSGNQPITVTFKSGNFGGPDFFAEAMGLLA